MNMKFRLLAILVISLTLCTLHSSCSEDANEENPKEKDEEVAFIPNENTASFGQKVDEKKVEEVQNKQKEEDSVKTSMKPEYNITKYRLTRKTIDGGRPYAVYDDIVPARFHVMVKTYLTHSHDAWLFNNYDSDDVNQQRTPDNTPWINNQDPLAFSATRLCKRFMTAVQDTAQDGETYYPYKVFGKIIRRGDHTKVYEDSQDSGDYSVMMFVNEFWRKNYYGELYLYDKNREIVGGATHKSARVVVWESTISRLNRPPAVQFLQGQILFHVLFSKNKDKMLKGHEEWSNYQKEREEAYNQWHLPDYKLPNGAPYVSPEPSDHQKFEFTTKTDGRKVFVFDNLFTEDLLNHLRDFVLKHGSYFYDDSIDEQSDNVQWIAGFLLKPYIDSPFWKVVKKVATHASGNPDLFPYDVSINLVRNSDHTRIHGDVSYYGEEEFTCLVYMNPNWTKNYYGETTFFEKNSDDTEIVAQVRPRYGRTVIFDGNIPHSARPPSFNFSGARLTFVTKLHKNEYTGRKKNFQEEMRHLNAAIHILRQLRTLSSKQGERFALAQLKELRELKERLSFRRSNEEEPDEDDDDEKHPSEDDDDNEKHPSEGEDGERKQSGEKKDSEKEQSGDNERQQDDDEGPPPHEFAEFFDDDFHSLPPLAQEIFIPLKGVNENTPEAVERIKEAHALMDKTYKKVSAALYRLLMKVM